MEIRWYLKAFNDLSLDELYKVLQLRNEVFIVEQNCHYQDMDNADQKALHLLGFQGEQLAAYTRLFEPGIKFDLASIGRVITAKFARGAGIGRTLMEKSIQAVEENWGKVPIKIGAQLYLKKFYESLGFIQCSEMYLEDQIPHIEMVRSQQ